MSIKRIVAHKTISKYCSKRHSKSCNICWKAISGMWAMTLAWASARPEYSHPLLSWIPSIFLYCWLQYYISVLFASIFLILPILKCCLFAISNCIIEYLHICEYFCVKTYLIETGYFSTFLQVNICKFEYSSSHLSVQIVSKMQRSYSDHLKIFLIIMLTVADIC